MSNLNKSSIWKSYRFPFILLGAIILGCIIGWLSPNFALKLSPFGDIFINLMFTAVVP